MVFVWPAAACRRRCLARKGRRAEELAGYLQSSLQTYLYAYEKAWYITSEEDTSMIVGLICADRDKCGPQ